MFRWSTPNSDFDFWAIHYLPINHFWMEMAIMLWIVFIIGVINQSVTPISTGGACSANQFLCANKYCVMQTWTCDGKDDCGDNSDETTACTGCSDNAECGSGFRCNSGLCVQTEVCTHEQEKAGCCDNAFAESSEDKIKWITNTNGAGGNWEPGQSSIKFKIANDMRCNGTANRRQKGNAIIEFNSSVRKTIVLSMEGRAEANYEVFKLFVDDKKEFEVKASKGDEDGCQPSTCKMCDVTMPEREIDLKPGPHTIHVTIDTLDEHFHNNAYFRITFAVKQKDVCQSCECPDYVIGEFETLCEYGMIDNLSECQKAAEQLNLSFKSDEEVEDYPGGCYQMLSEAWVMMYTNDVSDKWEVYFNKNFKGTSELNSKPICKF